MSALTLTLRPGIPGRVDMSGILPETLAGLSTAEMGRLNVAVNGRGVALGELFDLMDGDVEQLTILTESAVLDCLGAGMRSGCLRVEGPAGHFAGLAMRGGELVLGGDAGDYAASGMLGGLLRIAGDAGDYLGAARVGERNGMSGGVVAVSGSVGERAGDRMRRGLILIQGDAGDFCGSRLLAGSIAVAGSCGAQPGFGLRRGSLILAHAPHAMPATFSDAGVAELSYLDLLRRQARDILPDVLPANSRVHRYMGDLAFGGKGEILVAT